MHILYLHQYFATNAGTTGTRSYDFARQLVERGHRVTVATGMHHASALRCEGGLWSRQTVDGIEVCVLNVDYHAHLSGRARAASFLRYAALASLLAVLRDRPDVIYASCTPPTVGIPALAARLLRGVPYVYELRDLWPESLVAVGLSPRHPAVPVLRAWNRLVFRGARKLVTITPGFLEAIRSYGVRDEDVVVLPLGADAGLFPALSTATLRTGEIGPDDLLAVYAGSLGRVNNLGYMLEAMHRLKDRPEIKLLIVGDGREKAALIAQAQRLQLSSVVFRPALAKAELAAALGSADVGVNCVQAGYQNLVAFPNKAFDYLCAGLAVLTTAPAEGGGVLQELVEREGCGAGVDASRAAEAARCLSEWANDRDRLRELKERSRQLSGRYDRERLAERLEALLRAQV